MVTYYILYDKNVFHKSALVWRIH